MAKETTEQTSHEQVTVDEQKTVNLSAQSSTDIAKDSQESCSTGLRVPNLIIILAVIMILAVPLGYYFRHRPPPP